MAHFKILLKGRARWGKGKGGRGEGELTNNHVVMTSVQNL